jgi:hypothetical protein
MSTEELRHEIALLLEDEPVADLGEELEHADRLIDALLSPHSAA